MGNVSGTVVFENFSTDVAISFSGTNITSFTAALNYTDANLEVRAQLNFYPGAPPPPPFFLN